MSLIICLANHDDVVSLLKPNLSTVRTFLLQPETPDFIYEADTDTIYVI
jgi:hypothetical protein